MQGLWISLWSELLCSLFGMLVSVIQVTISCSYRVFTVASFVLGKEFLSPLVKNTINAWLQRNTTFMSCLLIACVPFKKDLHLMIQRRISTEKRDKNTPCYLVFLKLSFSITTLVLLDFQLLFLERHFAFSCAV